MTTDTFWSIPPIQDAIASYLDPYDYHACIRVSRSFHSAFIPFLWRHVKTFDNQTLRLFFESPALERNKHLVWSFGIDAVVAMDWSDLFDEQGSFPNLSSFSFLYDQSLYSHPLEELISLTGRYALLTQLDIRGQRRKIPGFVEVLEGAVPNFVRLKKFHLGLVDKIGVRDMARILGACIGVETLLIVCEEEDDDDSDEEDEGDVDMGLWDLEGPNYNESRIKALHLNWTNAEVDRLVAKFLRSCPGLECLEWESKLNDLAHTKELIMVIQNHCFQLQTLHLLSFEVDTSGLAMVLSGCPSLTTFKVYWPRQRNPLVRAILLKHAQTLEHLGSNDSFGHFAIHPAELFAIAAGCPFLKSLQTSIGWPSSADLAINPLSIVLDGMQPWMCNRLEILTLWIHCTEEQEPASTLISWLECLFEEIGRLSLLRELEIVTDWRSRAASKAFISAFPTHLTKLKEMRLLCLSDPEDGPLEESEIEMIVESWPKLWWFDGLHRLKTLDKSKQRTPEPARAIVQEIRERLRAREKVSV